MALLWRGLRLLVAGAIITSLMACGDGKLAPTQEENTANPHQEQDVADPAEVALQPAIAQSSYANDLLICLTATEFRDACKLAQLPLLGQQLVVPSIEDILQRTLVSHPWMGQRFAQLLQQLPDDVLTLLSSVTGIVISSDIRRSYYSLITGAIYFDANYFWVSNEEKQTLQQDNLVVDGNFTIDLTYVFLWRYLQGGQYAWRQDFQQAQSRTLAEIVQPFAAVMYHELAHANDYFQAKFYDELRPSETVPAAMERLSEQSLSRRLTDFQPLRSTLLFDLSATLYRDAPMSAKLRFTNAAQIGIAFQLDGANDVYSYSSVGEDFAMLFEEVMMKFHYDIDREVAFSDFPANDPSKCAEYIVRWGMRNRVGQPMVRSRAEFVMQEIFDQNDVSQYLDRMPAAIMSRVGVSWCEELRGLATAQNQTSSGSAAMRAVGANDGLFNWQDVAAPRYYD